MFQLRRFVVTAGVGLGSLILVGCGGGDDTAGSQPQTPQTKVAAAVMNSTVRGTVSYVGLVAEMNVLDMRADPICAAKNQENPRRRQALVLGDDSQLANVIVTITAGLPQIDHPDPTKALVFSQEGCQYDPHVFVLRAGQELKILNPDGTLHNIHSFSKVNPEFNEAMPNFRTEATKVFDQVETEPFQIKCDVHPWMNAHTVVLDHPYYAVTDTSGSFELTNLPAGTYTVQIWHERLGTQTMSVTVGEGTTEDITFSVDVPA